MDLSFYNQLSAGIGSIHDADGSGPGLHAEYAGHIGVSFLRVGYAGIRQSMLTVEGGPAARVSDDFFCYSGIALRNDALRVDGRWTQGLLVGIDITPPGPRGRRQFDLNLEFSIQKRLIPEWDLDDQVVSRGAVRWWPHGGQLGVQLLSYNRVTTGDVVSELFLEFAGRFVVPDRRDANEAE